MKSLEEILSQLEYLTVEDVENPKWKLEDLTKISSSLTEDNALTYAFYLALRTDLSDDEKDTLKKIIKIKQALEEREIRKKYSHFEAIV